MRRLGSLWLAGIFVALTAACGGGAQGSCNVSAGTGANCTEYSGLPGAVLDPLQNVCSTNGGSWSTGACTRTNATGACRRPLDVGSQTNVFYGGNADTLRTVCTASGGTWSN